MSERETVLIEIINGPEGPCLSVGDDDGGYRLAGPKPWGGGRTIHKFTVRADELVKETLALCPKARADLAAEREKRLVDAARKAQLALVWGSISDEEAISALDAALIATHESQKGDRP